jgi:uncharacterized protein (TIGR02270 family)
MDLLPVVRSQIGSGDEACSFWAAWSAVLLGNRSDGVGALKAIALRSSSFAERALHTLMRIIPATDARSWLKGLAKNPQRRRNLVSACGIVGDPFYVPWLIEQMSADPDLARIAGESFTSITGADLADHDLEGEWPEGFAAGPTENAEDEDVSLDPDEDLPWPDPERIRAWWDGRKEGFAPGRRYLIGEPANKKNCKEVLRSGMQRQRAAAALELALSDPRLPLFEIRAPGFRQRRVLLSA